jgi:hypothetical protein
MKEYLSSLVRGHLACSCNQVLLDGLLVAMCCTVHRAKIRCFEPKWPPISVIPQSQHRLVEIEKFLLHRFRSALMQWWCVACLESDVAAFDLDVLDSVEACIFSFEPKTRAGVRTAFEASDNFCRVCFRVLDFENKWRRAAGGVTYGCLRSDWSGAFGLASLLIGVLAVLLAVSSAGEYLGLERPVDDQVDLEGGKDDLTTPILQRVFRAEEAAKVGRV